MSRENVPYQPPRNILLNGTFRSWAAGTNFSAFPNATEVPVADNWSLIQDPNGGTAASLIVSRQPFVLGAQPFFPPSASTIPPSNPLYFLRIANSTPGSGLGLNSYIALRQHAADVRSLTDQCPCVMEFWMRSSTPLIDIGIEFEQQFGTGGSPSATTKIGTAAFSIYDTLWRRYETILYYPPLLLGKTEGTNLDSNITVNFYIQAGKSIGIPSSIGVNPPNANNIDLFGFRLYPIFLASIENQDLPVTPRFLTGKFSPSGQPLVYDPINNIYYALTAPGGVLTLNTPS